MAGLEVRTKSIEVLSVPGKQSLDGSPVAKGTRDRASILCKPRSVKVRPSEHGDGNHSLSMPLLWISHFWMRRTSSHCAQFAGWKDDGQEDGDAHEVRNTVNGDWSLVEARLHYSRCGASPPPRDVCDTCALLQVRGIPPPRFVRYVRKPEVSEQ